MPSVVFALSFILLGWIASHSVAYALIGFAAHDHYEWQPHGYLATLKLVGGIGLVLAFGLALRSFFRYGSFGAWLHEGGVAGTRKQVALATVLPATVFVLIEHLERLVAETGTLPSAGLLAVGVLVQLVVGLLCLVFVRGTFRITERVIHSIASALFVRPDRRTISVILEGTVVVRPLYPMAGSAAGRAPPVSNLLF